MQQCDAWCERQDAGSEASTEDALRELPGRRVGEIGQLELSRIDPRLGTSTLGPGFERASRDASPPLDGSVIAGARGRRKQSQMQKRFARRNAAAQLSACVALTVALAGCTWLYGPAVELPKDTALAVERPGIGARALLRANQCELVLASWGPALVEAIDALRVQVEPAQEVVLRAAIQRAYGPQRLFDRMATSVSANWDPDAAREIFAFYESWLGQRLLRAQASRRDAGTLAKFQKWSAGFDPSEHSAARVVLLRRIDRALLSSQTAVWLNRAMLDAGLAALVEGVPSGAAEPFRGLRAKVAAEESGLYPLAEEQVLRWNLYAFHWLSDSDLSRYAEFAESASAQWWVVSSARAYRVTLSGAGEDLFQGLRPRNSF